MNSTWKAGNWVYIEADASHAIAAEILLAATPAELLAMRHHGILPPPEVARLTAQCTINELLFVRQPNNDTAAGIWLLHDAAGWRDARGNRLTVTKLGKG